MGWSFLLLILSISQLCLNGMHDHANNAPLQSTKSESHTAIATGQDASGPHHIDMHGMYGNYPMERELSGTSWQPESTPWYGYHTKKGHWDLMVLGFANLIYDKQGGPRGDKKFFSTNMFMFMAQRDLQRAGTFAFRSMFSLDPLMGNRGYPLLFQTGETANGITPLIDRQHPHNMFMELAGVYSFQINPNSSLFLYFGMPGEPALGPSIYLM